MTQQSTLIIGQGDVGTAGFSAVGRDPMLGPEEWLAVFDWTDNQCSSTSDAVPANGVEFLNLAPEVGGAFDSRGPSGFLRNPGGTVTQEPSQGGLTFPAGTKDTTDYIEIGGDYLDMSANNDDFLVIVWDLQPLSGFNASSFQPIIWDTTNNANVASVWIDSGSGGDAIRGVVGNGGGSAAAVAGDIGQGALRQIAFSRVGTQLAVYVNGQLVNQFGGGPAVLQDSVGAVMKAAANHTGTLYRFGICKLGGTYDRPVADIVAQDWRAKPYLIRKEA